MNMPPLLLLLDQLCYYATRPFLYFASAFACCYLISTDEKNKYLLKTIHFSLLGPFFFSLTLVSLPLYLIGQLTWIILCLFCNIPDLTEVAFSHEDLDTDYLREKRTYTFASSNMLLSLDVFGKFQNMPPVHDRLKETMLSFDEVKFAQGPLENIDVLQNNNLPLEEKRQACIIGQWPEVDFFILQETWDRYIVKQVLAHLKHSFKFFLCNVSRNSLTTNLCTGSSGLLIASRYPILASKFHPFKNKKRNWQAFISYGIVMAKVDLDFSDYNTKNTSRKRRVGFVSSLHLMAYQQKENLIGAAMDEVHKVFNEFRTQNSDPENEEVSFAVIGGDFNFDNISPGDQPNQDHPLFQDYSDIAMKKPGLDHDWSVGTELRQLRIFDDEARCREKFRQVLADEVKRRHYIIDAEVKEQTMDLMYCTPKPNEAGEIVATPSGGRRRIDRILTDLKCDGVKVTGAAFITRLAGQTDHVPVAISLATKA